MSVHIPISREAQAEARVLLMATKNLLHPQNGKSSVSPSQDMVLGCYYLSLETNGAKGQGKYFTSVRDVLTAYENGFVTLHTKLILDVNKDVKLSGRYLVTTPGKIIFNQGFPENIPYVNNGVVDFQETEGVFDDIEEAVKYLPIKPNSLFDKGFLGEFISQAYNEIGENETVILLDSIKEKGFKYSTKAGLTFALSDVVLPTNKWEIVGEVEEEIKEIEHLYQYGRISKDDRHEFVIKGWGDISKKVADASVESLNKDEFNPIYMMIDSGARGSKNQYRQLAAMRGLMADPTGKTIERPILSNFKEGLDVFDYFISSHGARKGMADTSLKTADSGYLTRRLVDVAHDVVINENDCGTDDYVVVQSIDPESTPPTETLEERIIGRYLGADLILDGKVVFERNTLIHKNMAK
jgi:DNA-directed RNA polymerase subunit beta'